jgi:hypothetical protein
MNLEADDIQRRRLFFARFGLFAQLVRAVIRQPRIIR